MNMLFRRREGTSSSRNAEDAGKGKTVICIKSFTAGGKKKRRGKTN